VLTCTIQLSTAYPHSSSRGERNEMLLIQERSTSLRVFSHSSYVSQIGSSTGFSYCPKIFSWECLFSEMSWVCCSHNRTSRLCLSHCADVRKWYIMREVRVGRFALHASRIPDDAWITTSHRYGGSRIQVSVRRYELVWLYGLLHPVLVPDADCNLSMGGIDAGE